MDNHEMVYADALQRFASVFDLDMYTDGFDRAEMERETRATFVELERVWFEAEAVADVDACDIVDLIREAGTEVGCPQEWMEH